MVHPFLVAPELRKIFAFREKTVTERIAAFERDGAFTAAKYPPVDAPAQPPPQPRDRDRAIDDRRAVVAVRKEPTD